MNRRDEYFSRVRPIIGEGLAGKVVAARNLSQTGRVLELLSACMLQEVVVLHPGEKVTWPMPQWCRGPAELDVGDRALARLQRFVSWKNRFVDITWRRGAPGETSWDATLAAAFVTAGEAPHIEWTAAARTVTLHLAPADIWSFYNLTYTVARDLCAILLDRKAWPTGVTYHGSPHWPFSQSSCAAAPPAITPSTLAGKHVMVVGCGSIGSELVRRLASSGCRFSLVDPGTVSVFNPHRQWFGTDDIGKP